MIKIERKPQKEGALLFDAVIAELQTALADNILWLDHIFGKAERLVKTINGKRYYSPNIYIGKNDYELISPDSNFGNYAFFTLSEPQQLEWDAGQINNYRAPFSLIVWVDMRTIEDVDERNTEAVKNYILKVLNEKAHVRSGYIKINRIWEHAENVFLGFTLDEVDNQFLMHPFAGWRFEGTIWVNENCIEV